MAHALGKTLFARIAQRRTLINPSKWNNLLPTLLQLWHLDHVILLVFYINFFFFVDHSIDYIWKRKLLPCVSYCMGSDLDGASIFVIGFSSRLLLLDTAEVEMATSLLSLCFRDSWVSIVVIRVKKVFLWGQGFLAFKIWGKTERSMSGLHED